jgi:hypothetical protein
LCIYSDALPTPVLRMSKMVGSLKESDSATVEKVDLICKEVYIEIVKGRGGGFINIHIWRFYIPKEKKKRE